MSDKKETDFDRLSDLAQKLAELTNATERQPGLISWWVSLDNNMNQLMSEWFGKENFANIKKIIEKGI